jgi:hypothetical protein
LQTVVQGFEHRRSAHEFGRLYLELSDRAGEMERPRPAGALLRPLAQEIRFVHLYTLLSRAAVGDAGMASEIAWG